MRTMKFAIGDVWEAMSDNEEYEGWTWRFQIIAEMNYRGKKFYVAHKTASKPSSLQVTVFDAYGKEADSAFMEWRLCRKVKSRVNFLEDRHAA